MKHHLLLTVALTALLVWSGLRPLSAQDSYLEIDQFAEDITGIIWDLYGTSSLKHLRFDGENVCSLNSQDQPGRPYDKAFVDTSVLRLDFTGPNTGWYFFSDDLKWCTPITCNGEIVFAAADPSAAKPVKNFPADIESVIWESQPDDRGMPPMKLRWNGSELELGVKAGDTWQMEKHSPVMAERRVLEITLPDDSVVWFAFSADGKEAWFLQIQNLFGAENRSLAATTPRAAKSSVPEGIKSHHLELLRHAEKLQANGEKGRVATIARQLQRNLSRTPDLAAEVAKRLAK